MAHWVGAQGLIKLTKKLRKHDPIMTLPTEKPKPRTKKNFSISACRIHR